MREVLLHRPVSSRELSLVPIDQVRGQAAPRRNRVRLLVTGCVLVLLALLVVNAIAYAHGAMAQGSCAARDHRYTVVIEDMLSGIAARYGTTWMALAAYNHLANASLIMPRETICIQGGSTTGMTGTLDLSGAATVARVNLFPYGQYTWWANERYAELHNNTFVPWTWNSDAWQWSARARDFRWQVLSTPQVGDIIDLQPFVQGASALGHVAVVETILPDGDVKASSMNWFPHPQNITYQEFSPGPGVTFIRQ